jgi:hypothetical protein
LTTAALALSWILKFTVVMFAGIGMLGLRAALPTLLPVAMYLAPTRRSRTIAVGLLLGTALLMGTEQGIAGILAYIIVSALLLIRRGGRKQRLVEIVATLALAVVAMLTFLFCVGGWSGMRGAVHYNFSAVPKDQYWYFGVPPNQFISDWDSIIPLFVHMWPVAISILVAITACVLYVARLWRDKSPDESEQSRRTIALATLPIYGLISCGSLLGALEVAYAHPLWRVLLIIAVIELARVADARAASAQRTPWLGVSRGIALGSLALSLWTIARVHLVAATIYAGLVHIPRDHIRGHVKFAAAGIWPRTIASGQAIIDAHRGPNGQLPVLWSTYSGLIEARNGLFNPSYDYIIQALGKDGRKAYVDKFRETRPTLVQTMSPTYSGYEPWIENESWQFYDELLTWYNVTGNTLWSLYWERRTTPAPALVLQTTMNVAPTTPSIELPQVPANAPAPVSVLEIEVEYKVHNPLGALPLIGASPRYLIGIGGTFSDTPVSLAPYDTRARFFLFVAPGQKPSLHFQTFSLLPGASYTPSVVRVYSRAIDPVNQPWLMLMYERFAASR